MVLNTEFTHGISIVIPVYKGEKVLRPLLDEIAQIFGSSRQKFVTTNGHTCFIDEVILVHDCGPDSSDEVMRDLSSQYENVRCVWLSRNYGQHAATLAGIASSKGDWIVTIDEDGQQDPKYIPDFLDQAISSGSQIVYADPQNKAPHGFIRNLASRFAKAIATSLLASNQFEKFNSYRLILGESGRALAAYAGHGVYLDAALTWVANKATTVPVSLRSEDRLSGYSFRGLINHFGKLVVTAGARPLRIIALLGVVVAVSGFTLTAYIIWMKFAYGINASGWTSVIVAVLVTSGITMLALGVISEFLGANVRLSMGMPLYLVVGDPNLGPLNSLTKISTDKSLEVD